jgi:hypothetical protein
VWRSYRYLHLSVAWLRANLFPLVTVTIIGAAIIVYLGFFAGPALTPSDHDVVRSYGTPFVTNAQANKLRMGMPLQQAAAILGGISKRDATSGPDESCHAYPVRGHAYWLGNQGVMAETKNEWVVCIYAASDTVSSVSPMQWNYIGVSS